MSRPIGTKKFMHTHSANALVAPWGNRPVLAPSMTEMSVEECRRLVVLMRDQGVGLTAAAAILRKSGMPAAAGAGEGAARAGRGGG